MFRAAFIGLSLLAFSATAAVAQSGCKLGKMAELPVRMEGTRPLVTVEVNGKPVTLTLDTGAFFSSVNAPTAEKLGLRLSPLPPGMSVRGAGGAAEFKVGRAKSFKFAGAEFPVVDFLVGGGSAGAADGLLGQNILGAVDVEYDLANGVVRLFKAEHCKDANLAYWSAGKAAHRIRFNRTTALEPNIVTDAKVNGRAIRVMWDTGASTSVLEQSAATRLGFDPADPKVERGGVFRGVGRGSFETWIAHFGSFEIGGEEIKNTRLRVADFQLNGDMLLGADFFLSHRIFVANSTDTLYFTHNGGPVFRLRDGPPSGVAEGREDLLDAGSYSRRAAASLARRDYAGAIADLDKAVQLSPDDAALFHDRAVVRLRSGQPALAKADLDEALKINPSHVASLVMRGARSLSMGEPARAREDFNAARAIDTENYDIRLQIAAAYERAGDFPAAIAEYDAWIAAHPRDPHLANLLNSRCWARGLWGQELDKALADCNAAIRQSRDSNVIDSRGLIYLRTGDLPRALKDYDDALRLQPKSAWSLYGRGLTKIRMGREAEGRADIDAAGALDPDVPEEAARRGLAP